MPPTTIPIPSLNLSIPAEPLTPASFRPYGDLVQNPRPDILPSPSLTPASLAAAFLSPSSSLPLSPPPLQANQGTALKYPNVSQPRDLYALAPSRAPSSPQTAIFQCAARQLSPGAAFPVVILERHPFTTQMFAPLGADPSTARYLVVVAPSSPPLAADAHLPAPSATDHPGRGLPDVSRLRAFVAHGGQAVTYGAGTWHAPMVALGREGTALDFVVTQFANGVADEDCQEVVFDGQGRGQIVVQVPNTLLEGKDASPKL